MTETGIVPLPQFPYSILFVVVWSLLWCLLYSEKHLGSLWWPFPCFCMSNLETEVLVTCHKNVWMKVEIMVNVILFCKMPSAWKPPN